MTQHRVERIVIKPGHANHSACHRYCVAARSIYNAALYQMRQALFSDNPISASNADKILKQEYREIYKRLPSAAAQRTTQVLGDNWKGWIQAKKDWKLHPEKYQSMPKMPGYARRAKTLTVGRNGHRIKDGTLLLAEAKRFGWQPLPVMCCKDQKINHPAATAIVNDVRIVPLGTSFIVELVYLAEIPKSSQLNPDNAFGLDLGIDNLVTIVSTQQDYAPVLVKGKSIKSINARYNKLKAQLASHNKHGHIRSKSRKRYCQINDYFHKVSHWLIGECVRTHTGTLVIGLNKGWKNSVNIGRVNNQKFVSIPHSRLIEMIQYKAKDAGIRTIVREESYTSKASCLDLDDIPNYEDVDKGLVVPKFAGKRIRRGLYRSASGRLINSDVNGAANILRKEIGNDWLKSQVEADKGVMDTPKAINHIDLLLEERPRLLETTSNRKAA